MRELILKYRKIVIALVIIIMLMPLSPFRSLLFSHLSVYYESPKDKSGLPLVFVINDNPNPHNEVEALNYAHEHAKDTSGKSYWDMIKRYPDSTALYANVIQYYLSKKDSRLIYITPKSRDLNRMNVTGPDLIRSTMEESPELEETEYAIRMGRNLEPDNAYFDILQAYILYGLNHDQEAIDIIHLAASKKLYNSHCTDLLNARLKYGPRLAVPVDWFFPARKYIVATTITFPHLVPFKNYFRLLMLKTHQDDSEEIINLLNDMIHIAALIRDGKPQIIEKIVGIAVQQTAVTEAYYHFGLMPNRQEYIEIPAKTTTIARRVAMLESVLPDRLDETKQRYLRQQAVSSDRMRSSMAAYVKTLTTNRYMKPAMGIQIWFAAQSRLFGSIFWLGMLWLFLNLCLIRHRNIDFRNEEPKWYRYWSVTAIASLPAISIQAIQKFLPYISGMWVAWIIDVSILTFFTVIFVSISRKRSPGDTGWFSKTWVARMRKCCVYAMSGMVIIYIVSLIAFIPAIIHANKTMDFYVAHEAEIASKYPESMSWSISEK